MNIMAQQVLLFQTVMVFSMQEALLVSSQEILKSVQDQMLIIGAAEFLFMAINKFLTILAFHQYGRTATQS